MRIVLPSGSIPGKKRLNQAVADQAHLRRPVILRIREVAALQHRAGIDIRHIRRMPVDIHIREFVVPIPHFGCRAARRSDRFAVDALILHRLPVVELDVLVLQRFDDHVEVGGSKRGACNLEDVCAEVRNLLLHVEVRSLHNRHDRDQGRHAHREAHNGQDGAKLVRLQRGDTLRTVVFIEGAFNSTETCLYFFPTRTM